MLRGDYRINKSSLTFSRESSEAQKLGEVFLMDGDFKRKAENLMASINKKVFHNFLARYFFFVAEPGIFFPVKNLTICATRFNIECNNCII